MARWTEVHLLVEVAELGSLRKAAEATGLSPASATRALRSLEGRLGVQLIQRNTKRAELTPLGQEFCRRAKSILADWREAEAATSDAVVNPAGVLRVSASLSFSLLHLAPIIPEFRRLYPKLNLEIITTPRYENVIDSGIDVAVRTREHEPDSSIVIRRLAETRRILAASPEYLTKRGTPNIPDDLTHHDLLLFKYVDTPGELHFFCNGAATIFRTKGAVWSNDGQVLRAAAVAGAGIVVQPKYALYPDIVTGSLVPVLDAWDLPGLTVNLAFQAKKHLPAKVRAFVDFLVDHFERMQFEKKWTS